MKRTTTALVTFVLLWSAFPATQGPLRERGDFPAPGPGFGRGVNVLAVEPLDLSRPVLGIPYSADTVTEVTQQFADGNRVQQRETGSIARDASGRLRREQTLAGLGSASSDGDVRIVTIAIPVDRVQYRLDEAQKIAWRLRLPPLPQRGAFAERPPMLQRPGLKTDKLAPAQFEGMTAEGTRTVLVIPAGMIGNEYAIEVVSERWYSPELQAVVYTRRSDPRFGEVTYRLVNVVRAEPAPFLFEVPADFTVREQRPFGPAAR